MVFDGRGIQGNRGIQNAPGRTVRGLFWSNANPKKRTARTRNATKTTSVGYEVLLTSLTIEIAPALQRLPGFKDDGNMYIALCARASVVTANTLSGSHRNVNRTASCFRTAVARAWGGINGPQW